MSVVRDIDRGFKKLVRNFRRMRPGPNVTVGVQGSDAGTSRGPGFNNATLAAVHEFGSADGTIPQRSFLRATTDRERALITRMLTRAAREGAVKGDIKRQLGIVGEKVRSEVIRTIDQSIGLKALASSTIRAKGSTKPLIDTGILKGSITWEVHST